MRAAIIPLLFACACGMREAEKSALYESGHAHLRARRVAEAAADLGRLYGEDAEYRDTALQYGRVLFFQKKNAEAAKVLAKLRDRDGRYWRARALARAAGGQTEALALLDGLVREDERDLDAWLFKGEIHAARGETEAATAAYRKVIRARGLVGRAYQGLSEIYAKADLPEQARENEAMARQLLNGEKMAITTEDKP